MSIGSVSIGDHPVSGQASVVPIKTRKTPPKRQAVAKADAIAQPEAR